jgi:hypothetical protein
MARTRKTDRCPGEVVDDEAGWKQNYYGFFTHQEPQEEGNK